MRFSIEQLESRQLLATITWAGDVVTVTGTAQADALVAEVVTDADGQHLVFADHDVRIPVTQFRRLEVQLLAGNDSFVNNTSVPSVVYGGDGDDNLVGGGASDSLYGGPGADYLDGRVNDDVLDGGGQSTDVCIGGDGIDTIAGVSVTVSAPKVLTVRGTASGEEVRIFNDGQWVRVDGAGAKIWAASDYTSVLMYLGDGNDIGVNESNLNAEIWGEGGNDDLTGRGKDLVDGGEGHNRLHGVSSLSRIQWSGNWLHLSGTPDNDTLVVKQTDNDVYLAGMSTHWAMPSGMSIATLAGDDRVINYARLAINISGGAGDDYLASKYWSSTLTGDAGNDYLQGGIGNDVLSGGEGNDRLGGAGGADRYLFAASVGFERDAVYESKLVGAPSPDSLDFRTATNTDQLDFRAAAVGVNLTFERNRGVARSDERTVHIRGSAAEVIFGTKGNDVLNSHAQTIKIDGLEGDDLIVGNGASQQLFAGPGNNTVYGGGGNDDIAGGSGNDKLIANGEGDSSINGQGGDDWIQGSQGSNTINGGDGNDIIHGGAAKDHLYGGKGDDQIFGYGGDDLILADMGADQADGGEGNDEIWGSAFPIYSHELIIYTGFETDPNILLGGPGNDVIHGSGGQDRLSGGPGVDALFGDEGEDTLIDGSRNDEDTLESIELFPPGY